MTEFIFRGPERSSTERQASIDFRVTRGESTTDAISRTSDITASDLLARQARIIDPEGRWDRDWVEKKAAERVESLVHDVIDKDYFQGMRLLRELHPGSDTRFW